MITSVHFALWEMRLRHGYESQATSEFRFDYYMFFSSYLREKATLVKQTWWQKYSLPGEKKHILIQALHDTKIISLLGKENILAA